MSTGVPAIFDARRHALRRQSAARRGDGFFDTLLADAVRDRLDDVTRQFTRVLTLGAPATHHLDHPRLAGAHRDRADIAALLSSGHVPETGSGPSGHAVPRLGDYDLILCAGGLESLADLPGALALCRRLLRPDGLLLGAMFGDGSFPLLRDIVRAADGDRPAARLHPQVDVRTLGDLLLRAGLALPVVDADRLTLRYADLARLVGDLRAAALTNVLTTSAPALTRSWRTEAERAFAAARSGDGGDARAAETVSVLSFTGWAPAPSQPRPARRGSGQASLAQALSPNAPRKPSPAPE